MGGGGKEDSQIKGHSTICLTNLFQKCQGHEKQGKTKKLSQTNIMTRCHMLYWSGKEH